MSVLINNKKGKFNYKVLDKFEAGIELIGTEVKSLKNKKGNFVGSYVIIRGEEAFLVEAEIPAFQEANAPENYDPRRPRRLLLSKKEILRLREYEKNKGLTLIPLSLYNRANLIKVEIAAAQGKKTIDKREVIKKRQDEREALRSLKKIR